MPVKHPTSSMLGTAAMAIDSLGLAREAARVDDVALIAAVRRGEPGSREAVYHRYKRRVFALALRIVGPMEAEEVTQEAFIRIFRGLPKFRGEAALGTWIYRLAVNAALSHRTRRAGAAPPGTGGEEEVSDAPGARAEAPSGDAVLRSRLLKALWRLPVGYRTVVVLHDVEGLEHEEVAAVLGCHVGTSKSQLHKARTKLREILAAEGITSSALEDG
jgi:RNA polymerase sigma-70 factor (ECF subfamily)